MEDYNPFLSLNLLEQNSKNQLLKVLCDSLEELMKEKDRSCKISSLWRIQMVNCSRGTYILNKKIKVIFIPGNGGGKPTDNWFPYLKKELEQMGMEVIAREFPDGHLAREIYWIPFLKNDLKADENTILIGHSSGAIAAMRYAEKNRILGSILVDGYHTDLGLETEKLSGYFTRPWQWEAIQNNQQWIALFSSIDDPWIPIEEPRFLQQKLRMDYFEYTNQGHFGGDYFKPTFPEIVSLIKKNLSKI